MNNLHHKIALVTGASRGIGRATAKDLAANGARVLVHYGSSRKDADTLVAEIAAAGGQAEALGADLASPAGPHALAEKVKALGISQLHVLVLNAGVSAQAKIEQQTVDEFDRLFAINVRAPYFVTQQLLPLLKEGASVIFVSSLVARSAVPALSAYSSTKGAIATLVKQFASELGPRGIRVNAVAPGVINTDMSSFARSEQGRAYTLSMQALQRIGQPDDIAPIITFLASDASRWITGDSLHADGGSKL